MTDLMIFIFGLLVGVIVTIFCMGLSGTFSDMWYAIKSRNERNIEKVVECALDKYEERRGWRE